jgi:mannose-1-phosphate guanylyltransferase
MINKVDCAFILAAGKGSRMGKIGEALPKVLWPIFDKSLLELQVLYARSLNIKDIYINIHYYSEAIRKHIEGSEIFKDINILPEAEILDIGGGIHNLARERNYEGNVLILNCDQFYFINSRIQELELLMRDYSKVLFTYPIETRLGYNTLNINKHLLEGIVDKNFYLGKKSRVEQTYTGVSCIDLSSLEKTSGASSFFKTVANYKEGPVYCLERSTEEYWVFGTPKRYYENMFKLTEPESLKSHFGEFISKNCDMSFEKSKNRLIFGEMKLYKGIIEYNGLIQDV